MRSLVDRIFLVYNNFIMKIASETKQKILLLLLAGIALGFSRSPRNYFKILESVSRDWKRINRGKLYRAIREFYKGRLVDYKEKDDGAVEIVLTENGRKKALKYKLDEMEIEKPGRWDKIWRIVIFDIPEKRKAAREALRNKLKELGFQELQKSVFIFPYECEDEINFIVEVFDIRPYVRFLRVNSITNEEQLKIKFHLF